MLARPGEASVWQAGWQGRGRGALMSETPARPAIAAARRPGAADPAPVDRRPPPDPTGVAVHRSSIAARGPPFLNPFDTELPHLVRILSAPPIRPTGFARRRVGARGPFGASVPMTEARCPTWPLTDESRGS